MDTVLERMKDDMLVRNLAPATERSYIKYTADYIERFRQWPELLDSTHVRDFQLFLLEERKNGLGVRSTLQFVHFAFFIA